MKALIYLVSILFFFYGCALFNNDSKEEPLYEWEELKRFRSDWISAIATNGENELYVAQDNLLFYSDDAGATFLSFSAPDSADIKKIKIFDRLYIIGDVHISNGDFFGSTTSYVYASDDNGRSWEEITGRFIMQDIVVSESKLHIGRKHGVTTYDLEADSTLFRNSFINSRLSDHIEEITASEEGIIYLASHDGIYFSQDQGENWQKISTNIGKDDDFIRSISVDNQNDIIYAAESDRLYFKSKIASNWESKKMSLGTELVRNLSNGRVIVADSDEVLLSEGVVLNFKNIGPFYEETESDFLYLKFLEDFSDDKIVIADRDHLFIGTPNNN